MSKIPFFVLFFTIFVVTANTMAQDYQVLSNSICITRIIDSTGLSIDEEREAILQFIGKNYNSAQAVIQTNTNNSILVKGVFPEMVRYSLGLKTASVAHTMELSFKEGRMRVDIYASDVFNETGTSIGNITGYAPINANYNVATSYMGKKQSEKLVENTVDAMQQLHKEVLLYIRNYKRNNNW